MFCHLCSFVIDVCPQWWMQISSWNPQNNVWNVHLDIADLCLGRMGGFSCRRQNIYVGAKCVTNLWKKIWLWSWKEAMIFRHPHFYMMHPDLYKVYPYPKLFSLVWMWKGWNPCQVFLQCQVLMARFPLTFFPGDNLSTKQDVKESDCSKSWPGVLSFPTLSKRSMVIDGLYIVASSPGLVGTVPNFRQVSCRVCLPQCIPASRLSHYCVNVFEYRTVLSILDRVGKGEIHTFCSGDITGSEGTSHPIHVSSLGPIKIKGWIKLWSPTLPNTRQNMWTVVYMVMFYTF